MDGAEPKNNLRPLTKVLDRALLGDEGLLGISGVFDARLHELTIAVNRLGGGDSSGAGAVESVATAISEAGERIESGLNNLAAAIRETARGAPA